LKRQFIPAKQHGAPEILQNLLIVGPRRLRAIAWHVRQTVLVSHHQSISVIRIELSAPARRSVPVIAKLLVGVERLPDLHRIARPDRRSPSHKRHRSSVTSRTPPFGGTAATLGIMGNRQNFILSEIKPNSKTQNLEKARRSP
jgi:hypothetical protein